MAVNLPLIDAYWRVGTLFGDTAADSDRDPDIAWADEGTITLIPVVDKLTYTDENGRQATLANAPKTGVIKAGGRIAWEPDAASENNTLRVVDLTDPDLTGHVTGDDAKTHTLVARSVRAAGQPVFSGTKTEFGVRIGADMAGPDGTVNLAPQIPVTAAAPVVVDLRKGDTGVGVTNAVQPAPGKLALTLDDGTTTSAIDLPPGTLPDDPSLAAALGGTQAKAALSAQIDGVVSPVAAQAVRTAKAVFNVIDYGATLDGVADDTAALQEAINAAQALAKRACIRIPFGEAKTTGVSITSPFIDLEGPGALRGTLTIGTTTHQAMYCTVRNVRFVKSTGNDDGTGINTAGNGIELMSVEKVNIEGCQFVGHDAAINIPAFTPTTASAQQTMQISISSCTFWWTNYALKGRIVSGGSWMSIADIDISDCLQVLTYISAVDLASCDGLKISGSTFFCKGNPYQYKQQNIKVGRTSWVAITGNNLFEPGREAIALTDPGSFSITGNTIAWPGEYVPSDAISITLSASYTSVGSISGNMASQFTKNLVGIYGSGNASGITLGANSFAVSTVPQPSYYGPSAHPTSQYRYYTDSALVGLPQIIDAVQSVGSVSTDNLAGNNYESRRRLGAQHTIASRGIVKTITAATGVATLSGTNSPSVYGGIIVITAQSTTDASKYASYTFFAATSASSGGRTLTLLGSGGLTSGSTAGDPSFTWSMTSGATLTATPVGSTSGSFTFYASTIGNLLAL